MDDLILSVHEIQKTYDTGEVRIHALPKVDLRVQRGEMVTIMGPSG